MEYTRALVQGIQSNKEKIDSIIQTASSHWKVQRMALVDRNVLRIAVFEMKVAAKELEPQIAINEAIELAKKYGSTDSGGFVNGVLDQIAKGNSWQ
jgi:N utilization substance protein B